MRRELRRGGAVLACAIAVAAAAAVACNLDVIVGEDPSALADGGDPDARADALVADRDALADASGDAQPSGPESVLSGIALSGASLVVAGHQGGATGEEPASDAWLGRLRADATEQSGAPVDTQAAADAAHAALAFGATDWIAAGFATTAAGRRAWVRRLDAADAPTWTRLLTPTDDAGLTSSEATSLVGGVAQTILVGGNESAAGTLPDGWVTRLDGTGAVVWRTPYRGTGAANTLVYAIGVNDFDQTFTGGQRRVPGDAGATILIPALVKLSSDGSLNNSAVAFGAPAGPGAIRGVLPFGNMSQDSIVCLESGNDVYVTHLDLFFVTVKTQRYTDARGPIALGGCTFTSDDGVLVVGTVLAAAGAEPWAAKLDRATLTPLWNRPIPTASPAHAVAVTADGAAGGWAVGYTSSPVRRWASKIAP
jgi:hypothetical protein